MTHSKSYSNSRAAKPLTRLSRSARLAPLAAAALMAVATLATASSHREAPFITTSPKVDGSDFYMFNSYETGRSAFVTLDRKSVV